VVVKIRARIGWWEEDERRAVAVASALEPCNREAPRGMKIHTYNVGRKVITEIEMRGRPETLAATIDDLLACALVVQRVLKI